MTDADTKYRALVTACCALYGPFGPAAAWWLWSRRAKSNQETRMETMIQPKITGYRELSESEAELMNEIKAHGVALGELVAKLRVLSSVDPRWVNIGATDLQTGLMALTRAVARPTSF